MGLSSSSSIPSNPPKDSVVSISDVVFTSSINKDATNASKNVSVLLKIRIRPLLPGDLLDKVYSGLFHMKMGLPDNLSGMTLDDIIRRDKLMRFSMSTRSLNSVASERSLGEGVMPWETFNLSSNRFNRKRAHSHKKKKYVRFDSNPARCRCNAFRPAFQPRQNNFSNMRRSASYDCGLDSGWNNRRYNNWNRRSENGWNGRRFNNWNGRSYNRRNNDSHWRNYRSNGWGGSERRESDGKVMESESSRVSPLNPSVYLDIRALQKNSSVMKPKYNVDPESCFVDPDITEMTTNERFQLLYNPLGFN